MAKVSVVINAFNEEKNLPIAAKSIKGFADEIVVVDTESEDSTASVAKKIGAKVFSHKKTGYVEPVRNFAIGKATGDWIFILDADEELTPSLAKKLLSVVKSDGWDFVRIPRKNKIFGKWIKHSIWWPDFQIRFFKRGFVSWGDEIHSIPVTRGKGIDLPQKEEYSIVHNNYKFLDQYIERLFRYTKIQAEEMMKGGYVFKWRDVIRKPLNEFLSRFFSGEGYKDGVHGLILSLLQSFSELVVYIRVWEKQGFKEEEIGVKDIKVEIDRSAKDIKWWVVRKLTWLKYLVSR